MSKRPCATDYQVALGVALRAYEIANFREFDEENALARYYNHADTHKAVKVIAHIILDEYANDKQPTQ